MPGTRSLYTEGFDFDSGNEVIPFYIKVSWFRHLYKADCYDVLYCRRYKIDDGRTILLVIHGYLSFFHLSNKNFK